MGQSGLQGRKVKNMSTQAHPAMVPPQLPLPLGAPSQRTASLASPYKRQTPTIWQAFGQSVWRELEAIGRRRAARELMQLAQRRELHDPAQAQQFRDASRFLTNN
jgi:hypothetical protein